jgi:hypothetical protein
MGAPAAVAKHSSGWISRTTACSAGVSAASTSPIFGRIREGLLRDAGRAVAAAAVGGDHVAVAGAGLLLGGERGPHGRGEDAGGAAREALARGDLAGASAGGGDVEEADRDVDGDDGG